MAFPSIIRIPTPAILPPAIRLSGSQRYHHSFPLFCNVNHSSLSRHVSRKSFQSIVRSSKSKNQRSPDESLLRAIESEITKAGVKESDGYYIENSSSDEQVPKDFPFKIQDNPGEQMILLTREYKGESISVEVYTPDEDDDEDDDEDFDEEDGEEGESHEGKDEDDEDEDEDEDEDYYESTISLAVKVSKKSGPILEFSGTAYPDELKLDYVSLKDPENPQKDDDIAYLGPKLSELDEDLLEALYKYLEIRGLNNDTAGFLHDYMTRKDRKEYTLWLRKLKKFIEA